MGGRCSSSATSKVSQREGKDSLEPSEPLGYTPDLSYQGNNHGKGKAFYSDISINNLTEEVLRRNEDMSARGDERERRINETIKALQGVPDDKIIKVYRASKRPELSYNDFIAITPDFASMYAFSKFGTQQRGDRKVYEYNVPARAIRQLEIVGTMGEFSYAGQSLKASRVMNVKKEFERVNGKVNNVYIIDGVRW